MQSRTATCRCGQFRVTCQGAPVRVSVCHCLNCQRRSGSAFAYQARWPDDCVEIAGTHRIWATTGENGATATFRFCDNCGSTVAYASDAMPGLTAVAVGAFADPDFPAPHYSVYEGRMHGWLAITDAKVEHFD